MKKIKINTVSGTMLEKPLVTAFLGNGNTFLVFDNEMNGTMGLPIILVSKLVNNNLVLVKDEEWNGVKEVLRQIISGNQVDYALVGDTLTADDVFFKQLTLPVASFDALKNSYKPSAVTEDVDAPVSLNSSDVLGTVAPNVDVAPVVENVVPTTPIMPEVQVESQTIANVEPVVQVNPVMENVESTAMEPVAPVAPAVEPVTPDVEVPIDFTADKEAFLKACENMFDALVAKFNNK